GAAACAAAGLVHGPAAQPQPQPRAALRVTQLLDMSASQQELSRDYSTGVRLAFAQLRPSQPQLPQLVTLATDGSDAGVQEAVRAVSEDASQLALLGTVGESLALRAMAAMQGGRVEMAHIAPWLSDTRHDRDPRLLPLFASREQQLHYALHNIASMGVGELALVYPEADAARRMAGDAEALASSLRVKVRVLAPAPGQALAAFAARLPAEAPFFLVFVGASVELAQFTSGLGMRGARHQLVCLSGVDPATYTQLVSGPRVPVVFTQVVPNVHTGRVPMVRAYRQALSRLFDEQPSPVSLAGYVAGRYAAQVFARLGGAPTRAQVLAETGQRRATSIDEWPLNFASGGRGSSFVDQVLLNAKGDFVGT
ncbi:MAG: hypothetical protein QM586_01750, partial [Xenophilus sp.]